MGQESRPFLCDPAFNGTHVCQGAPAEGEAFAEMQSRRWSLRSGPNRSPQCLWRPGPIPAAGAVTPPAKDAPQLPVPDKGVAYGPFLSSREGLTCSFQSHAHKQVLDPAFPTLVALGTIQRVRTRMSLKTPLLIRKSLRLSFYGNVVHRRGVVQAVIGSYSRPPPRRRAGRNRSAAGSW